jgi:hypothetical protein
VRDDRDLDVFISIGTADKDPALDAAHTMGLMLRDDPPLQQNVDAVRVGNRAGDGLTQQDVCRLPASNPYGEPAVWLR